MKTRAGYVSNSSSSSFVVIKADNSAEVDELIRKKFLKCDENPDALFFGFQEDGEMCFGWRGEYYDILSKWNWLLLQAWYAKNGRGDGNREYDKESNQWIPKKDDSYFNQLKDYAYSIDPDGEFPNDAYFREYEKHYTAYIDHQSIGNWQDTGLAFEDIELFLQEGSYIQCGNDNE